MINTEFLEIHFDISVFIGESIAQWDGDDDDMDKVIQVMTTQGKGGIYELAESWATEFYKLHTDTVWGLDLDYHDTLDSFLEDKNKIF